MTDSNNKNTAEPPMNTACPKPANGSAFPCPKRCSASAGIKECLMARRLTPDATTSSKESTRELNIATESVISHATALATTRIDATVTAA